MTGDLIAVESKPAVGPKLAKRVVLRPVGLLCVAYLIVVALTALIAPIALPGVGHEQAGDLLHIDAGPSSAHLLGTDSLGRDELDRLLVGTRITMIAVLEAVGVCLSISLPLGVVAGFLGGRTDRAMGWIIDLMLALPGLILVLVVISIYPNSTAAAMTTLGILMAPSVTRVIRSAVLPVRQELYVDAARVSGLRAPYIIVRHILPRIAGPIIIQTALVAAGALLAQTGLLPHPVGAR